MLQCCDLAACWANDYIANNPVLVIKEDVNADDIFFEWTQTLQRQQGFI